MKKVFYILLTVFCFAFLAACAKKPAPVSGAAVANTTSQVLPGKFAAGPHQGLLGQRQYYFACNSDLFPGKYQPAALAQAAYLKAHADDVLTLQGYSAAGGSAGYNAAVAQQRTASVANFLRLQGVSQQQLRIVSYGSAFSQPYTGKTNPKSCRVDLVYSAV
jgi:peptidoglycan-associated lipoprotein